MTQTAAVHRIDVQADGTVNGTDDVFTGVDLVPTPQAGTDTGQLLKHAIGNSMLVPATSVVLTHATPATGPVRVSFPSPATTNNALLLVHDSAGGITWHKPDQPTAAVQAFTARADTSQSHAATGAAAPTGQSSPTVTFTIPKTRFPGSGHLDALHKAGELFRHFVLHTDDGTDAGPVHSVLSLLEYPIAHLASMGVDESIDRWDRDKHPATIRWFPPNGGHHVAETVSPTNWSELAKGKALLFVHGIFSSCNSGFGSLINDETFWTSLQDRYEGRDHRLRPPDGQRRPGSERDRVPGPRIRKGSPSTWTSCVTAVAASSPDAWPVGPTTRQTSTSPWPEPTR